MTTEPRSETTIIDVFWRRVKSSPEKTAILFKQDGAYKPITWEEHGEITSAVAAGLLESGIEPGDQVAVLSSTRAHWTWADLGILSIGARTVPIYSTLSDDEVRFLVNHSHSKAIFAENERQLLKIIDGSDNPPEELELAVIFDGEAVDLGSTVKVVTWSDFLERGRSRLGKEPEAVSRLAEQVREEDLATIVYTSGTTGIPKGAMILHGNIYKVLESMAELISFSENDLALAFLPLSHVYERVSGQFLSVYHGLPYAYAESMEKVAENMTEVRPTVLNAVPRFYEKAYQRVQVAIRQMPPAQQGFIRWAIGIGKRATKQRLEGSISDNIWNQLYRAEMRIAERLVFAKIRERFGGRLRLMTSGAAPLSNDVHLFFEAIGIPIMEGYGLTETCAPLACNRPDDVRFKTVGKPIPGIEVKLAEDGELLVRGPSVFAGYFENEEATSQAFSDGWFKTGDIARIDEGGYITITDRKKDIIITAGGKHIAPQMIENLFKGDPMVAHVVAYGDRRKYITALFTLNPDALADYARKHNISYSQIAELTQNARVRREIERLVEARNKNLPNFQRIKRFLILSRELSIEENELTPTMKVKRKVITEKYLDLFDSMYDTEDLEAQRA
ncbi:MAG: long-chain fatty acid--CoA ligase [Candidatus Obscuribacterales bacterium]